MNQERFLKCIGDNNRRRILECLGDSEKCVNEIIEHTQLEQTLVSFHLKALKNCGLVKSRREGKKIIYQVSDNDIIKVLGTINKLVFKINELQECKECE